MEDFLSTLIVMQEDEFYAPFSYASQVNDAALRRLGVMNNDNKPIVGTIHIFANACAYRFLKVLAGQFMDIVELQESVSCVEFLLESMDYTGLYYFIVGNCRLVGEQPQPELIMMASKKPLLELYMKEFTDCLSNYMEQYYDDPCFE